MLSTNICGPLCQHPGCWKAKKNIGRATPTNISEFLSPTPTRDSLEDLPTLSISTLCPNTLQRHRALPPLSKSQISFELPGKPHSSFHCFRPKEIEVPRVSHIIVQAGFQCHMQKRWVWLPSVPRAPHTSSKSELSKPHIKDMTNELIQSRPASSKIPPRNIQTRIFNSRPKGTSYLDLVRKVGYLNLLDLPHHLQVKLLENAQFRKILSSHPIDHLPYNSMPESALLDLVRCQMSPQLPNNPSLEGVGIFFDPPDDMGSKPEHRAPVISRRPDAGPVPNTYVPMNKVLPTSDLPGPWVVPAMQPSFRDYVMSRCSTSTSDGLPIRVETNIIEALTSTTLRTTSETATVRSGSVMSERVEEEEEEEEREKVQSKLEITLPEDNEGIRIPSAIEDDELELATILANSVPPTRDSWRGTAFSTVTPLSPSMITPLNGERTQIMSTLHDTDTYTNMDEVHSPDILPPTCTPTEELRMEEYDRSISDN